MSMLLASDIISVVVFVLYIAGLLFACVASSREFAGQVRNILAALGMVAVLGGSTAGVASANAVNSKASIKKILICVVKDKHGKKHTVRCITAAPQHPKKCYVVNAKGKKLDKNEKPVACNHPPHKPSQGGGATGTGGVGVNAFGPECPIFDGAGTDAILPTPEEPDQVTVGLAVQAGIVIDPGSVGKICGVELRETYDDVEKVPELSPRLMADIHNAGSGVIVVAGSNSPPGIPGGAGVPAKIYANKLVPLQHADIGSASWVLNALGGTINAIKGNLSKQPIWSNVWQHSVWSDASLQGDPTKAFAEAFAMFNFSYTSFSSMPPAAQNYMHNLMYGLPLDTGVPIICDPTMTICPPAPGG